MLCMLVLALVPSAGTVVPEIDLLSLDPNRVIQSIDASTGTVQLQLSLPSSETIDCTLHPFEVTTPATRFVLGTKGGADRDLAFDSASVRLLRGTVVGEDESSIVVAMYGDRLRGRVLRSNGRIHNIADPGAIATPGFRPPDRPLCELSLEPGHEFPSGRDTAGPTPPAAPNIYYRLQLAVETDWEYRQLFDTTEEAAAYVVLCYGLIADIYLRETNAYLELTYVRLWETPDDLFNEESPLGEFRQWWNQNMQDVPRNLAQFFSGRRNLPYGGAAYLAGICRGHGYSVMGYLLGFTGDVTRPDVFNYDVHVAAHEIGHNCATYHTHDYGLDDCNDLNAAPLRGPIMSYCSQTTSGGNAVTDVRFHSFVQQVMMNYYQEAHEDFPECFVRDCNGNGTADAEDISSGSSEDTNGNGMPDECEDCNGNGTLDPLDLLDGTSQDVNLNGIPDECEPDCNGNTIPDALDISSGVSLDTWGNGIPDECEADCDGDGQSDYNQVQEQMDLDIDRDLVLDSCQDCDGDGMLDLDALDGAWAAWVGSNDGSGQVVQFHSTVGTRMRSIEPGTMPTIWEVVITGDRRILVTSTMDDRVVEYDENGALVGDLVPAGAAGLDAPTGMAVTPGGTLLVSSTATNQVLEYDLETGEFLGIFAEGDPWSFIPLNILVTVDDRVLIVSAVGSIEAWDYNTGKSLGTFVDKADNGGLAHPRGLAQIRGGDIVIASMGTREVLRFDGENGAFVGAFNNGGTEVALTMDEPWGVRVGPEGHVYVSRHGAYAGDGDDGHEHDDDIYDDDHDEDVGELHINATRLYIFDGQTGNFIRSYITGNDTELWQPTGFDFMPGEDQDCNHNGRHDECDIISGTSQDDDGDGIPDECQCPADTDGNGEVNVNDLLAVLMDWGTCPYCPGEITGDGFVNVDDLLEIIGAWGSCN